MITQSAQSYFCSSSRHCFPSLPPIPSQAGKQPDRRPQHPVHPRGHRLQNPQTSRVTPDTMGSNPSKSKNTVLKTKVRGGKLSSIRDTRTYFALNSSIPRRSLKITPRPIKQIQQQQEPDEMPTVLESPVLSRKNRSPNQQHDQVTDRDGSSRDDCAEATPPINDYKTTKSYLQHTFALPRSSIFQRQQDSAAWKMQTNMEAQMEMQMMIL